MKKALSCFQMLAIIMISAASVFYFGVTNVKAANELLINEFKLENGAQWIELINTTGGDIDLSGWTLVALPLSADNTPGGPPANNSLSGLVPAKGMLVIGMIQLWTGGAPNPTFLQLKNGADVINAVSYGPYVMGAAPRVNQPDAGAGESAILTGTSSPAWSVTSSISMGWFNETTSTIDCENPPIPGTGVPPTLGAIAACIPGIVTNMASTSSIPDPTHATGLYFSTSTNGRIDYGSSTLNLTDQNTRTLLQTMGEKMRIEGGKIGLNAASSTIMQTPPSDISISFYNMKDHGYANIGTSSLRVKDDNGDPIATSSGSFPSLNSINWDPNSNNGTFSFNTNHFSEYDINPTVVEVTPVSSTVTTNTPSYTFATNVTGTAVFGGDCAMAAASTTNGNNTVIFGPLLDGTHSNCTVKVIDGAGASTTLAVTSFTTITALPGIPAGLSATPVSENQINLSWTATTTADYYNIYGGTVSTSLPLIASTTNATYNNTSLTADTLYYYKISGVNIVGEGASSTAVSTTTLPTPPPAAPTGVTATATSTSAIAVGWTASTSTIDYYNVYGSTDNVTYTPLSSTTSSTLSYTATGNATNTLYYYKVSAVSGSGETTSTAANAYTFAAVPTAFISTASSTNSISLQWSANGNPASTTYYVNTGIISTSTTATTTVLSGLTPNTSYTINIIAINGAGVSTTAVTAQDWTKAANPTSLAAVPDTTSVSLSWNGNSNPSTTTYRISGAGFATSTVTTTSAVVSGLTASTSYAFNVSSQNNDGSYNSAATLTTSTLPIPPPNAPVDVGDIPTSTSAIIIYWSAPATNTPDYYKVYSATSSMVYAEVGSTTSSTLTFTHNGNGPSTKHFYYVASVNSAGETNSSALVSYTFPNAPTALVVTASTSNSLNISWSANGNGDNSTDNTQYEIYLNGTAQAPQVITTTKNITSLIPNTQYSIVVKTQSGKGDKSASSSAAVDWTKANAPTGLANTSSSASSLTFSWSDNSNPAGTIYIISGTGPGFTTATTTATAITVSGLNSATNYTLINVSAYNSDGTLTSSSTLASAATYANDPSALISTASTTNSITLQWSSNGNSTSTVYKISGGIGTVTTTATTTNMITLQPNTSYTFTVQAQNPDSSYTTGVSVSDFTKAAAPVSLITTASSSASISLGWGDNGNPAGTSYWVGNGSATSTITATSTVFSGLTPNTQYAFSAQAINHDGTYTSAVTSSDYTKAVDPVNLSTVAGGTYVTVGYDDNNNPNGTIYRVSGIGFATVTTSSLNALVTGLTMNTAYTFLVQAQNNDGTYTAGATTSGQTSGLPTVVTDNASSIASTTATLNGNIMTISGAKVWERGFAYGLTTAYGATTTETSSPGWNAGAYAASISSLSAGTNYHVRAYAVNDNGTSTGSDMMFTSAFAPTAGNPTSTIGSSNTATNTINVTSDVTNPTVDLSAITAANSSTLPGAIDANVATSLGTVNVDIPAGTVISSTAAWSGVLNLPAVQVNSTITNAADTGYTATVAAVVEVGFGDTPLTLSNPARILIPGMGGKLAGWSQGGTFHKITNTCASDSAGGFVANECKINVNGGADLVIWTNHFTYFVAYTQTQNTTGGSSGGGYQTMDYTFKAPTGGITIKVNNGAASTNSANVTLTLNGGTDAKNMAISNSADFTNVSQQAYASTLSWKLTAGNGAKTVYVKFYNQYGYSSAAVSASINLSGQTADQAAAPQAPASNVLAAYAAAAEDLVKSDGISSAHGEVYYIGADLKAYLFPTRGTYGSWYPDFSALKHIRQVDSAKITMGNNATARAGANLVRFANSNAIYAVTPGAKLCALANAGAAKALYGAAYTAKIIILPSLLLDNYTIDPACKLTAASKLPDGALFQYAGDSQTYLVQNGLKRAISANGLSANMLQQSMIIKNVPATMVFSNGLELISREDSIAIVKGQ